MADGFDNLPATKVRPSLNWATLAIVLMFANLILLNYFLVSDKFLAKKVNQATQTKPASPSAGITKVFLASPSAGCDAACQQLIEQKVAELKNELATQNKSDSQPTSGEFTGERTVYFGA